MLPEIVATQVCYTPAEYYAFLDGIRQGSIRLAGAFVVVGYLAGRFTPIVLERIRKWYNGRTPK
jgi:uncharacterized protein YdaT